MSVRAAAKEGPPPFATVLEQHGRALLRFCIVKAGPDRAEDVFQETMLAALRAYGEVRDPAAVRSWLFTIAARKAVDAYRRSARAPVPVEDVEAVQPVVEADAPDSGDGIWTEVARLPDKQRQAVTLRYMADLKPAEIAGVMGISEDAVRRNIHEGLRKLRRDLTDQLSRASN